MWLINGKADGGFGTGLAGMGLVLLNSFLKDEPWTC